MKTLNGTIGKRINEFDNFMTQNVKAFNTLFPECPIKQFDESAPVEILSPESNNCRRLLIGGLEIKHKMFSDSLYNMDRDEYNNRHDEENPTEVLGFIMKD
jgi:hypothetical protein